jgi:hypothetical protein
MMATIIAWTALYLFLGMIMFLGVWKEIERDDTDISDKSRLVRIAIRMGVFAFWPILFMLLLVSLVWRVVTFIWESFTE